MSNEPFLSKTEHILYICYNTRYHGGKGDMNEFERTIPLINVYEPTSLLSGEHYTPDYIAGMYPELENALKDYKKQFKKKAELARAIREREGSVTGLCFDVFNSMTLAISFKSIVLPVLG